MPPQAGRSKIRGCHLRQAPSSFDAFVAVCTSPASNWVGNGYTADSMRLCLFDPGISTHDGTPAENLGNLIIQQAVLREIHSLFAGWQITPISTFAPPTPELRRELRRADLCIAGGTNLLTSEMNRYRQWVISPKHALGMRRTLLLGVGWWTYQNPPNLFTRIFLRLLLSGKGLHSLRDQYSVGQLAAGGFRNAINTCCPTLWPLANAGPDQTPVRKAQDALLLLTDYDQDPEPDQRLIDLLHAEYRTVYFWPQGATDLSYIQRLKGNLTLLDRSFDAFTRFTRDHPDFDYIGTRLHGGVHCLNHRRRSLIIEIDNRAAEIRRDTGLKTARRGDVEAIRQWIREPAPFSIRLPVAAIQQWRSQFHSLRPEAQS